MHQIPFVYIKKKIIKILSVQTLQAHRERRYSSTHSFQWSFHWCFLYIFNCHPQNGYCARGRRRLPGIWPNPNQKHKKK